jgi:hypothetical protein
VLQRAALVVDRAAAAEVVVVLGDLGQPRLRHVPSAGHGAQERQHVRRFLRAAEGDQQEGVVPARPAVAVHPTILPAGRARSTSGHINHNRNTCPATERSVRNTTARLRRFACAGCQDRTRAR